MCVSAGWVLIQTSDDAVDRVPEVVGELSGLPGVERAEQTVGAYDVVVRVCTDSTASTDSGDGDPGGHPVPSAKRVARAALRIAGVSLAVCCHDGPVDQDAPRDRTIDLTDLTDLTLTDEVFGQPESGEPRFAQPTAGGLATL